MKKLLNILGSVFFLSYLLNFFWESIHAVLFYKDHATYESLFFVKMISYATFFDAVIISGIFLGGCLIWRSINWLKEFSKQKVLYTVIVGFIIAVLIEAKALFFGQWSYNDVMPTIFGMGLSPLIQLSITGLITFFFAKKLFYGKKS